ncbi:hypothetical protein [Thermomonas sp. HDW16]|uniref:hypothetical protein n=1 Tax=Thermomonas sp. HDW16 TaxID=2714945 RepID=UPI00140C1976|nr:hypothetical protein G7079_00180 [Thermomonas sp. HDW16]
MTREQLDATLRHAVILGTVAVLLIPAARGSSEWLGWLPLWLVGMPLAAWWSLRGFPLPQVAMQVPRRRRPQARRQRAQRARASLPVARRA